MALVGLYPILTMPKRASDSSSHQKKKKKKKKRAKTDKPGPSSASSGRASAKMTGASIKMTSGADTGIVLATFPGGPPAPGTLPGASCFDSLEAGNQTANFELETHWRMLIVGGGVGAGMFLHADTLRTSSWQLQIRGRKR